MLCEICDQTWHEHLYVLVEFPDDATYFEENDIGYPSFESEDNGARYVSEYDYIQRFEQDLSSDVAMAIAAPPGTIHGQTPTPSGNTTAL